MTTVATDTNELPRIHAPQRAPGRTGHTFLERSATPKDLATIEKVSAPSMTRTVNALVDLGLVARADDPTDGRQVILSLTPAGRETIKETRRRRHQWFASQLETLTDDERALLVQATALLERVAAE